MPTTDIDPDLPRVQYTATPGQTVFAYPFIIFDQNDLEVIQEGSVLTIGAGNDYTVTGVENENGGTIVLTSGAADGDVITIIRKSQIKRISQFQTGGRLDAAPLERSLDFIVTVLQEIDRDVQRTIRLADDDSLNTVELPEDRAGKFLSFLSDGSPTVADAVDITAIPFGATGTSLAATNTPANARNVLELGDLTTITSGLSGATTNQVLTANGSGGATFQSVSIIFDTTPQLGGMLDVNGQAIGDGTNELLTFTEDASAVNHINIENEATGSGPIISAVGDDANIDLNLNTKGTGTVKINGLPVLGEVLHVQDQKPQNTASQSIPATTWTKRDLNTVIKNTITGASLSSSQITLPAGTYYIDATTSAGQVSRATVARVFDTTASSEIFRGVLVNFGSSSVANIGQINVSGWVTLTVETDIELQVIMNTAEQTLASNLDGVEVYSDLKITRIA